MSKSKVGILIAAAVGAAFLTVGGCASQGSGAATPANLPNNCQSVETNACKNKAGCKNKASCSHAKKHHHKTSTTVTTQTSTEEAK